MSESEIELEQLQKRINELEKTNNEYQAKFVQIDRDRIEYLQNVSHQLVAPLNAIKWHIENLTEGRINVERAKKVLKSVYSQATIAVHLAKNFNLMSNLETDHSLAKLKEPLEYIDLRSLMVNLSNDFQPLAWDKEIDIRVDDEHFDKAPKVLAMKPLISQAFSNIIENAVKYSHNDTEIIIQAQYLPKNDCFVVLIKNQGIPLKLEYETKVFDRGFRSEDAKSKYPAGTGFGLYIAKKIVEIHEGKIRAYSLNGWTIFEVTLTVNALKGKARVRV